MTSKLIVPFLLKLSENLPFLRFLNLSIDIYGKKEEAHAWLRSTHDQIFLIANRPNPDPVSAVAVNSLDQLIKILLPIGQITTVQEEAHA